MLNSLNIAGNLFIALFFSVLFSSFCFAQNKIDIEVKVQTASDIARGGEKFAYTITVTNKGSAKATDVIFIQDEPKLTTFESYVPSKGTCEVDKSRSRTGRLLRCRLGDMKAGESVVTQISLEFQDFGDPTEKGSYQIGPYLNEPSDTKKSIIGTINAYPEEPDENTENNSAEITAELLPSRNIPPRVEIISPKNEEVIARSTKKPCLVVFKIKAFDPDGTVEKVIVRTQQFSISIEYPENKYVIEGKKYSIKEVEDNMEAFKKYFGGEAKKIGKDTYTFTLENPEYGLNTMGVEAVDNGKRVGFASVRLMVKGDNSIEFTKPVKDSIIKPNTDLVIETLTKLNDGKLVRLQLIGNALCCENHFMRQVSQNGNSYVHQYLWKNIPKGYYYVQVILIEDTGAFTYSEGLQFKVTEKPKVKITSLKEMQIFKQGEEVPIEIEASDADGEIKNVSVSVDGKYEREFSWRQGAYHKSGYISSLRKGIYKINAKVADDTEVETESEPITIIVK